MFNPYITYGANLKDGTKIRRKGVLIIPKKLREAIGLRERDEVIAEVVDDKLILKALRPKIVDINPKLIGKILEEEYIDEEHRYRRIIDCVETGS